MTLLSYYMFKRGMPFNHGLPDVMYGLQSMKLRIFNHNSTSHGYYLRSAS